MKRRVSLYPVSEDSSQIQEPDKDGGTCGGTEKENQTRKSETPLGGLDKSDKWNASLAVQIREPLLDEDYIVVK